MGKKLVAYFSASGVTEQVAKRLCSAIGGDLHKIVPAVEYTRDDLDWRNKNSRSSLEMKDKSFRPEIRNRVADMSQYDVIYVGFPIWWYVAPTIINTFLEEYDLTGKTVIPFATSGGSGMGRTNDELALSCGGAILKDGKRFSKDVTESELKSWAENT